MDCFQFAILHPLASDCGEDRAKVAFVWGELVNYWLIGAATTHHLVSG